MKFVYTCIEKYLLSNAFVKTKFCDIITKQKKICQIKKLIMCVLR